jgi:hypothetical protein
MRWGAATAVLVLLAGGLPTQAAAVKNNYSEQLLRLSPQEQAARLANFVGFWCVGAHPFLMGVTQRGTAAGYAYWSLECAGGESYAIQLDPHGEGNVTECHALQGSGRECFRKF